MDRESWHAVVHGVSKSRNWATELNHISGPVRTYVWLEKSTSISCPQLCMLSCFSHVQLFVAPPWTVAHQAHVLMGCSWQEYWNGFPCPAPGDLPNPGIERTSPSLAGRFFTTSTTWEAPITSTTTQQLHGFGTLSEVILLIYKMYAIIFVLLVVTKHKWDTVPQHWTEEPEQTF